MDKLKLHTPDKIQKNFAALAALFPNAVTETIIGYDENAKAIIERAIDADVLRQEINAHVVEGKEERYQFTWPDKKKSVLLANAPIAATLRPCREESVDFDNTKNLYIEGDNLDVLKLLQETYLGKVKMIYIDPPYNTGNDFIYGDDFAEDTREFLSRDGQYDDDGNRMVKNLDGSGRFHTDWLNMIYPRLRVARDLLSDDGVIFISIGDIELDNLKKICDEIFGEANHIAEFVWNSSTGGGIRSKYVNQNHEYCLCYARDKVSLPMFFAPLSEEAVKMYNKKDENGIYREKDFAWKNSSANINQIYPIVCPDGSRVRPKPGYIYRFVEGTFMEYKKKNYVVFKQTKTGPLIGDDGKRAKWNIYIKKYLDDGKGAPSSLIPKSAVGISNLGTDTIQDIFGSRVFNNAKSFQYLSYLLNIGLDNSSIILDFFSGSATTAHAAMRLNSGDGGNRKFIMVQLPEVCPTESEAAKAGYKNICEIGQERIRRAGEKIKTESPLTAQDLDTGFRVLKLDSSNMKDVYCTPQETIQRDIYGLTDNIKEDRSPEDLLFQVMLDLGILLSSKIERRQIADAAVFSVMDNYLIACFDSMTDGTVTEIARLKPYYAVFRDKSFASDSTLANFEQIFATYSPTTVRRVL
ncbi:MAG: site-specific DNA-methyltransferase [Synergistaceae bacterium]|jgi:adenine-specific DNA-methyltransferase|nr:site-specific DNA-methyltransferase [Synergistaceae bacterium]